MHSTPSTSEDRLRSKAMPDSVVRESVWLRRFWLLLAVVFVARLGVMLLFVKGADLAGDEAYYWDWGRRPDWCYYSKPPMIGWMMGAVGWLTNNAEWGIRLTALILGTTTLVLMHRLARTLFDASTAFLAAGLTLLTIANAGLNLFLTIDAPLLLFWTLALLLFWQAVERPESTVRWLALGLVIGAGVLSKQMMLVFPVLMLMFAAVSRTDRALLKNPRLWGAVVLGTAFMLPVLKWNQEHAWITVEHTRQHFDAGSLGFMGWISRTLENAGLQALIHTPVTFAALVAAMTAAFRSRRSLSRQALFLLLASAPALAFFVLLALRQRINPNWPAVFFVPAYVLAAAWMCGLLRSPAHPGWQRWSLRVGGTLVAVLHLALVILFGTDLGNSDRLAGLRGWRELGLQAQDFLDQVPQPEETFVMALGHRYHAAQMAFYMPSHPRLYRWEPGGKVQSQYEIWPGPEECLGRDALILDPAKGDRLKRNPVFKEAFEKLELLGEIRTTDGAQGRVFSVYLGKNLKSWRAVRP